MYFPDPASKALVDDWEVSNYEEESKKRQQEDLQQWTEERKQDEWDQLLDQGRVFLALLCPSRRPRRSRRLPPNPSPK